jgi:hypothetical protein
MTTKKLSKILQIIDGYVYSNNWNTVLSIVKNFNDIEVLSKKWSDDYKNNSKYYPLDLSKIETWSTYERCVNLQFKYIDDKLICNVKIYEGRMLDGWPTKIRFTAVLALPNSFICEIENEILWKFDNYASDEYENHLENQRKLWINEFKNNILNDKQ